MNAPIPLNRIDRRPDPRSRILLAGTVLSLRQLHRGLVDLEPIPLVVGGLVSKQAIDEAEAAGLEVPILGEFDDLAGVVRSHGPFDQVLISLPVALRDRAKQMVEVLEGLGVAWRFIPTLADQLAGRMQPIAGGLPGTGEIDTNALINRRPRPLDEQAIGKTLSGRCVLITGAGGSIGSEMARVVSRFGPSKLVLVERSENALFEIDREIARTFPGLPRVAVLHDVTDTSRTLGVVLAQQPHIIFHAAAHKHVPMMEDHPAQAVENNFFGTRSIADAADQAGTDRFVMISTDKAVNPSSVMGATKRLAELYISHLNTRSGCAFSMVRFGNVLGSACSVLPIWGRQLARGGPITVTHPDMSRYFMTIPEAAGLVLQSACFESGSLTGGEVFLLDMGQPVRVLDLAKRYIRSHGLEPGVDVAIRFTGPRPGEKLFEEMAYASEDMLPTEHESVRIWRTQPPDPKRMEQIISTFDRLRCKGGGEDWQEASHESIFSALRGAVPEMVTSAAG